MSEIHLVLQALAPDRPPADRQRAGRALLAFLRDERSRVVLSTFGTAVREEALARCVFKVIRKCQDPDWLADATAHPSVARSYLDQILRNAAIDQISPKREGRRDEAKEAAIRHSIESDTAPDTEQARIAREIEAERRWRGGRLREQLRQVAHTAIEERRPRDQAKARDSWRQIEALVFEEGTMPSVLRADEGIDDHSSEEEIVRARNRIFANHSRFRRAMAATVDRLAEEGTLSARSALQMHQAVRFLFRCQNQGAPDVFSGAQEHPNSNGARS